jgi:hypothetical protein
MGDFGVNQATKTWVQGAVVCHYINQGEPRWTERVSLPTLKNAANTCFCSNTQQQEQISQSRMA